MPTCKNPECGKEVPEGMTCCDEACMRKYVEFRKQKRHGYETASSAGSTIEAVLNYMGIDKQNFAKNVAYQYWAKFVGFVKDNSGKSWNNFIKPRLRSYVGIDYRYLEDFLESCR